MTLSRKLTFQIVGLAASLAILGGASLWGLTGLRKDVQRARDEYQELRIIQDVDMHLASVHGQLVSDGIDSVAFSDGLRAAVERLEDFLAFQDTQVGADPYHQARERYAAYGALTSLRSLLDAVQETAHLTAAGASEYAVIIRKTLDRLEELAVTMDQLIEEAHHAAGTRLHRTIAATAVLSAVIVLGAVLLNMSGYRNVMRPLNRLRSAVRRVASGDFARVAETSGDAEFVELARDFNRMAAELDELYSELEDKVRTQSAELARSERLASVGFLAAGVAHEINNPLNIISGYTELSLKQLSRGQDEVNGSLRRSLEIVLDETFRCKRITEQLLSLARTQNAERQPLRVADLLNGVVGMVEVLPAFRQRQVTLDIAPCNGLSILGREGEMKQVLLNLVVNALESVDGPAGHVELSARYREGQVEITVQDNGRGMSADVLNRVFEPFFTRRRGSERHGVGLGLAISHAIVQAHGGRIRAESEGTGRGSRFIVEMPASCERASHEPSVA